MVDNGHKFEAAVVPEDLIHYSFTFRSQSVWPQWISKDICCNKACLLLERDEENTILVHCKSCPTCAKQRVQKTQFEKQIFEPGVQPMEFICIDLIGEFYPPSSKGNRYALTAVCMLTGFTFCILIKNKTAQ